MDNNEVYISFDIEADGPYPGDYSMLSIGLCVAGQRENGQFRRANPKRQTKYIEFKPISEHFVPEAMAVNGLDREALFKTGSNPETGILEINDWIEEISNRSNPVLVAYPSTFDWPFLTYYFGKFLGKSPAVAFTRVCDLRTLIVAKSGQTYYTATDKCLPSELLPQKARSHNALRDAMEQAELFANVQLWTPA